ncbi:MAG: NAD(P)-dependent oxidoreductase [Desulfobacterales bacterium]|uniref:NAD(P)-dependent oxidoreductase n=1 Tax=Candidatus Desulfatibia vada TaxID=2841696 RepID=A0A8J6P1V8_9BACT|nr:NAD(P)-dependent oxidoreductase [Candidatus Desulfatibia vada]MBL6970715.1 NAD(P)-dependent oxidoreductase [Desulfobacterales bacterium]
MNDRLPGIVVTGASGFIGRHFVIAARDKFRIFCIARRSQKEAGIPKNDNIHWLQADITKWQNLLSAVQYIRNHGGTDYVLHLAGYYDFTMKENLAYEQTNVIGTQHLLNMSKLLKIKRFIFSSSVAACKFPLYGEVLTEESPADADFPYGHSKRRGEALIKKYSDIFPCSIVRLAAVYSDWCEYPVLYMLLRYWLSKNRLISMILAGHGETAVPFIHIEDLISLFLRIIAISDLLPRHAIYIASPQGSVSHNELYKAATRYYYGHNKKPFLMPKPIAALSLIIVSFLGRLSRREILEKPWMAEYIDKKLSVDASATYTALGWKPKPRYHILRRLLFLNEKMISRPQEWAFRNETFFKRVAYRKSTIIYDILAELREPLIAKIIGEVIRPENDHRFPNYRKMDHELLKLYITWNYQLVAASVRNRDRAMIPNYAKLIAHRRFVEGFKAKEVKELMFLTATTMKNSLLARQELKDAKQRVDDYIIMTAQFAADELEDTYEMLEAHPPEEMASIATIESLTSSENLKQIVRQLEDVCGDSLSNQLSGEVTFKDYGVLIKLKTQNDRKM